MKRKRLPNGKKIRIVHLCKGCMEMLKEYNPYLDVVAIITVPIEKCDNYTVNGEFVNLNI